MIFRIVRFNTVVRIISRFSGQCLPRNESQMPGWDVRDFFSLSSSLLRFGLPLFFAFSLHPRETNLVSPIAREKKQLPTNLQARTSDRRRVRSRKPPNLMRQRVSNFNQARMDALEFSHLAMPLTSLNASGRDASEMCRVRDGSVPFIISQIYVYLCVCNNIYIHIKSLIRSQFFAIF